MDIEAQAKIIRSKLEKHTLPIIKLRPKADNVEDIWSSKFGGKPYWPKNMEYPESRSGEELVLLAQLNFHELPSLAEFPQSGILQFFIEDDDVYGMDFDTPIEEVMESPSGYRVIFHPIVERNEKFLEQNHSEAHNESYLPISREYCVESTLGSEIPSPTDFRYKLYAGDPFEYEDELAEYIYENFSSEGSKIGGYANFTQEDPRVNGEHDNWVLLFQMDSEFLGEDEIMWGDMGVGNFFIEKRLLRKMIFQEFGITGTVLKLEKLTKALRGTHISLASLATYAPLMLSVMQKTNLRATIDTLLIR